MQNRPNISKHLQNQSKPNGVSANGLNKPSQKDAFMSSPLFAMAKTTLENMPKKYKYMMGAVLYLIFAGVSGTIYAIIKLITLFI